MPLPLIAPVPFLCGTLERIPVERPALVQGLEVTPPGSGLGVRDAFGEFASMVESEHFVLKWGPNASPSQDEIDGSLEALEDAWIRAFDDMAFIRPDFTDAYKVNVYIGNSGGDAPSISFVGGYTTMDSVGFAYIVMHPNVLDSFGGANGNQAASVFSHEFHHVVQFGADAYWQTDGLWYWESSASWFASLSYPTLYSVAYDGAYFRMMPHLPLDYFEGGNGIAGYHQYAASVFLLGFTETLDDDIGYVRDSWTTSSVTDSPIDVLDSLLPDGMAETYTQFALDLTRFDYSFGEQLEYVSDAFAAHYSSYDDSVVAHVGESEDPVDVDDGLLPGAYAFNVIVMDEPTSSSIEVAFVGEAEGSMNTDAAFDVWITADGAMEPTRMDLVANAGSLIVEGADAAEDVTAIVVSHPGVQFTNETFDYDITFRPYVAPEPEDTGVEDTGEAGPALSDAGEGEARRGCGCASGSGSAGMAAVLVGLLAVGRRRRS